MSAEAVGDCRSSTVRETKDRGLGVFAAAPHMEQRDLLSDRLSAWARSCRARSFRCSATATPSPSTRSASTTVVLYDRRGERALLDALVEAHEPQRPRTER